MNPNHDPKNGEFSSASGSSSRSGITAEKIRKAIEWIKHPDTKKMIANSAVTYAIQNALFKMSHVEDPIADQLIEQQVHMIANHVQVTKGHARNMMIAAINKLLERTPDK
jgi:hypothetical protein